MTAFKQFEIDYFFPLREQLALDLDFTESNKPKMWTTSNDSSSSSYYLKGTGTTAMTASATIPVADVTGAAPLASPTFTGAVTAPIYATTPQALTFGSPISWNPANGLNASVTLTGNGTLSFSSPPTAGAYGTLVVTQDGAGS